MLKVTVTAFGSSFLKLYEACSKGTLIKLKQPAQTWQNFTVQQARKQLHVLNYSILHHKSFVTETLEHQGRVNFSTSVTRRLEDMTSNRFMVDYAKMGTSGCKRCKQKLSKGELRIAKVVANPFSEEGGDMKMYHHAKCLFESFIKARSTTKIIEDADDLENFDTLTKEDQDMINELIKETLEKKGTPKKKTPAKKTAKTPESTASTSAASSAAVHDLNTPSTITGHGRVTGNGSEPVGDVDPVLLEKDNSFRQYRKLCADIAEEASYNGKTQIVSDYLNKGNSGGGFKGDVYLLMKLLLPGVVKVVYNLNNKQLIKLFSLIFATNQESMLEHLNQGDVAETVKVFFEQSRILPPAKKSSLSLHELDDMLTELSTVTKEDDQQKVLTKISKRCTSNDLKMVVRLIKRDLRINAGGKHILDALDPNAYQAFQASRDLRDVVERVLNNKKSAEENGRPGMVKKLSVKANLMTPILPMLAEACKSVDYAFKKCTNGMYAEIKYDGERVQVHKKGDTFQYFSRSLKPVLPHKVSHFKDFLPKAFPHGNDMILDSEVLLIDTKTSKPLPFGTLGVHKKAAFQDANVCLFIFDCLHFNGENLMNRPIKERRKFLHKNMTEIPNRILFSEMHHISEPGDLKDLIMKVIREGLEGLVLKDRNSAYEPGKRHWLKVKKDYLAEGAMADTADLVVLGAFYGTGNKGGMMSIFLMGVYDPDNSRWCTVTKCSGGFDDKTLERLQKELDMIKIGKNYAKVPSWLNINKNLVPDFVVTDPKKAPVWEITGAEFSQSEAHTADGISIRFPRCTKMRDDKSWEEATDLPRLKIIYKKSKETSDIPDLLGGASSKGGRFKKKKEKVEDVIDVDNDVENGDGRSTSNTTPASSAASSPVKTPVKRKASDESLEASPVKKAKQPCHYGNKCYQTNPEHKGKYDHSQPPKSSPAKNDIREHAFTKKTLPDVFKGMKIYIPENVPHYAKLKRYIIAFDGDIVSEFGDKSAATHAVVPQGQSSEFTCSRITADWLWQCIKQKKIVPQGKSS